MGLASRVYRTSGPAFRVTAAGVTAPRGEWLRWEDADADTRLEQWIRDSEQRARHVFPYGSVVAAALLTEVGPRELERFFRVAARSGVGAVALIGIGRREMHLRDALSDVQPTLAGYVPAPQLLRASNLGGGVIGSRDRIPAAVGTCRSPGDMACSGFERRAPLA